MSETTRPRPRPKPTSEKSNGGEVKTRPRPAPRPKPTEKSELDNPTDGDDKATMSDRGRMEKITKSGTPDTQSRVKGEQAQRRAESVQGEELWPRGIKGRPMIKLEFAASELIPTGQYANVTVGPVRATGFIDLDRDLDEDEPYFSQREADMIIKAANELAEHIEGSVVAVQRDIVLDNLQNDDDKS